MGRVLHGQISYDLFGCIAIKREEADYLNGFKFSLKQHKYTKKLKLK